MTSNPYNSSIVSIIAGPILAYPTPMNLLNIFSDVNKRFVSSFNYENNRFISPPSLFSSSSSEYTSVTGTELSFTLDRV